MWDENPYGIVVDELSPDPDGERVAALLDDVGMAPVAHHVRQRRRRFLETATWEWFTRERPGASQKERTAIEALRTLLLAEGELSEVHDA